MWSRGLRSVAQSADSRVEGGCRRPWTLCPCARLTRAACRPVLLSRHASRLAHGGDTPWSLTSTCPAPAADEEVTARPGHRAHHRGCAKCQPPARSGSNRRAGVRAVRRCVRVGGTAPGAVVRAGWTGRGPAVAQPGGGCRLRPVRAPPHRHLQPLRAPGMRIGQTMSSVVLKLQCTLMATNAATSTVTRSGRASAILRARCSNPAPERWRRVKPRR